MVVLGLALPGEKRSIAVGTKEKKNISKGSKEMRVEKKKKEKETG